MLRDPTPNNDKTKWKQADDFPLDYMLIGNGMATNAEDRELMRMQKNLYPERTNFWENLNANLYKTDQWLEERNEID